MHVFSPSRQSYYAKPIRPEKVMVYRRTVACRDVAQGDGSCVDVVINRPEGSSLVLEEVPEDCLYQLPAAIGSFLRRFSSLDHCPPIPVLRLLGLRTQREVDQNASPSLGLLDTHTSSLLHTATSTPGPEASSVCQ